MSQPQPPPKPSDDAMKWILPVGRSPWAIAAGYAGLFALLVYPAPIALLLGLMAYRDLKKNPDRGGKGRALFGTAMGVLGTALLAWIYLRA